MVRVSTAHAQRRVASCARRAASLPHRRLAHKRRLPAPAAAACTSPPRGAPSTAATAGGAAAAHATVNSPQPALGLTLSLGLTVGWRCAAGSACACRVGVALLQQHAGFLQDVCCHATIVGSERCLAGRCSRPGSRTRAVRCCAAAAEARPEGEGVVSRRSPLPRCNQAAHRTSQWPGQPRRPSARRWQQPAASVVAACAAAPTSAAAPSRSSR